MEADRLDATLWKIAHDFASYTKDPALTADDFHQNALIALTRQKIAYGLPFQIKIGKMGMTDLMRSSQTRRRRRGGVGTSERLSMVSLTSLVADGGDGGWALGNIPALTGALECMDHLWAIAEKASKHGREIVRLRGEGYELKEIGKRVGITEARVSQIVKRIRERINQ